MPQLLLWSDDSPPASKPKKPRYAQRLKLCPKCARCKADMPARSVMPVGHAVQTVMGIMAERLDSMLDDVVRIVWDEFSASPLRPRSDDFDEQEEYDAHARKLTVNVGGRLVEALNYRFFPELYEDGEPYQPDPAGRMEVPPNPIGLVPRTPTVTILARHWLEQGRLSPVAALNDEAGGPLFSDAELARLGERIEKAGRSA